MASIAYAPIEYCDRVHRARTPVGLIAWTWAVLGIYRHFAQMYTELRRRYKAKRAREIVQREVQRFLSGDHSEAA